MHRDPLWTVTLFAALVVVLLMVPIVDPIAARIAAGYAPREFVWHDPGPPERLDFAGTFDPDLQLPAAPFTFEKEDLSGTQPKIFVRDARRALWNVKFGFEAKPESFSWRIV